MKISVVSPGGNITYEDVIASITQKTSKSDANTNSGAFAKALNTTTVAEGTSTAKSYKDIFIILSWLFI